MAKKENSALDGTKIQLKRSKLHLSDSKEAMTIDDDGVLAFGEPIYILNDGYLLIGDGETKTSDLPVITMDKRGKEATGVYFSDYDAAGKLVTLTTNLEQQIFPRLRHFGTFRLTPGKNEWSELNPDGSVKTSGTLTWYKVDANGMVTNTIQTAAGPRACTITVNGMANTIVPIISQVFTGFDKDADIRKQEASFAAITAVQSLNGSKLVLYCGYTQIDQGTPITFTVYGG